MSDKGTTLVSRLLVDLNTVFDDVDGKVDIIDTNVDTLLTRLTVARALLLDELTAARMEELDAANLPADIDTLKQRSSNNVSMMEFWSDVDDIITLTTATTNVDLPNVTITNIPSNSTFIGVYGVIKFRAINNTNIAINAINGANVIKIKKSTGAWGVDDINLITIADNILNVSPSTKEGGIIIVGNNNVAGTIDTNSICNMRFDGNIFVDGNNLELIDVQVGLQIYFTNT